MNDRIAVFLLFVLTSSFNVIADDQEDSKFRPGNDENIHYSLPCQCFAPLDQLHAWSDPNQQELELDFILSNNNIEPDIMYDVKYRNGPWSFFDDFGNHGTGCVKNIYHRGYVVRVESFDTENEKQIILKEWKDNPVEWRPPDTVIKYYAGDKKPSQDFK